MRIAKIPDPDQVRAAYKRGIQYTAAPKIFDAHGWRRKESGHVLARQDKDKFYISVLTTCQVYEQPSTRTPLSSICLSCAQMLFWD